MQIQIFRVSLLALVLSAGSAIAQQPSPEALATAKELITVKGGAALYEPVLPDLRRPTHFTRGHGPPGDP